MGARGSSSVQRHEENVSHWLSSCRSKSAYRPGVYQVLKRIPVGTHAETLHGTNVNYILPGKHVVVETAMIRHFVRGKLENGLWFNIAVFAPSGLKTFAN